MFTVYIHTLEVLAMHPEGTTVKQIVSMGVEWSSNKIHSVLQSLMDEGYVTCDDSGRVNIWQITEKAAEYTGRIARLWEESQVMNDIADYVREAEKQPSNPFVGVIEGAYEELPLQMVVSGDYVFSVDENGVPDHAYVGLANDDGSLPFDAIVPFEEDLPLSVEPDCFYTQMTGRCEECDELVERHFCLCDACLKEHKFTDGEDAYAQFALPVGTIPHLRVNHPLPPFDHSDYEDIPF